MGAKNGERGEGEGCVECITRRPNRRHFDGRPCSAALQSCVKMCGGKDDRGRNINQSSPLYKHRGWLPRNVNRPGLRESLCSKLRPHGCVRACVPRARTSSFEVVHGRKIGKHDRCRIGWNIIASWIIERVLRLIELDWVSRRCN